MRPHKHCGGDMALNKGFYSHADYKTDCPMTMLIAETDMKEINQWNLENAN